MKMKPTAYETLQELTIYKYIDRVALLLDRAIDQVEFIAAYDATLIELGDIYADYAAKERVLMATINQYKAAIDAYNAAQDPVVPAVVWPALRAQEAIVDEGVDLVKLNAMRANAVVEVAAYSGKTLAQKMIDLNDFMNSLDPLIDKYHNDIAAKEAEANALVFQYNALPRAFKDSVQETVETLAIHQYVYGTVFDQSIEVDAASLKAAYDKTMLDLKKIHAAYVIETQILDKKITELQNSINVEETKLSKPNTGWPVLAAPLVAPGATLPKMENMKHHYRAVYGNIPNKEEGKTLMGFIKEAADVVEGYQKDLQTRAKRGVKLQTKEKKAKLNTANYIIAQEQAKVVDKERELLAEQAKVLDKEREVLAEQAKVVDKERELLIKQADLDAEQAKVLDKEREVLAEQAKVLAEQGKTAAKQADLDAEKAKVLDKELEVANKGAKLGAKKVELEKANKDLADLNKKVLDEQAKKQENEKVQIEKKKQYAHVYNMLGLPLGVKEKTLNAEKDQNEFIAAMAQYKELRAKKAPKATATELYAVVDKLATYMTKDVWKNSYIEINKSRELLYQLQTIENSSTWLSSNQTIADRKMVANELWLVVENNLVTIDASLAKCRKVNDYIKNAIKAACRNFTNGTIDNAVKLNIKLSEVFDLQKRLSPVLLSSKKGRNIMNRELEDICNNLKSKSITTITEESEFTAHKLIGLMQDVKTLLETAKDLDKNEEAQLNKLYYSLEKATAFFKIARCSNIGDINALADPFPKNALLTEVAKLQAEVKKNADIVETIYSVLQKNIESKNYKLTPSLRYNVKQVYKLYNKELNVNMDEVSAQLYRVASDAVAAAAGDVEKARHDRNKAIKDKCSGILKFLNVIAHDMLINPYFANLSDEQKKMLNDDVISINIPEKDGVIDINEVRKFLDTKLAAYKEILKTMVLDKAFFEYSMNNVEFTRAKLEAANNDKIVKPTKKQYANIANTGEGIDGILKGLESKSPLDKDAVEKFYVGILNLKKRIKEGLLLETAYTASKLTTDEAGAFKDAIAKLSEMSDVDRQYDIRQNAASTSTVQKGEINALRSQMLSETLKDQKLFNDLKKGLTVCQSRIKDILKQNKLPEARKYATMRALINQKHVNDIHNHFKAHLLPGDELTIAAAVKDFSQILYHVIVDKGEFSHLSQATKDLAEKTYRDVLSRNVKITNGEATAILNTINNELIRLSKPVTYDAKVAKTDGDTPNGIDLTYVNRIYKSLDALSIVMTDKLKDAGAIESCLAILYFAKQNDNKVNKFPKAIRNAAQTAYENILKDNITVGDAMTVLKTINDEMVKFKLSEPQGYRLAKLTIDSAKATVLYNNAVATLRRGMISEYMLTDVQQLLFYVMNEDNATTKQMGRKTKSDAAELYAKTFINPTVPIASVIPMLKVISDEMGPGIGKRRSAENRWRTVYGVLAIVGVGILATACYAALNPTSAIGIAASPYFATAVDGMNIASSYFATAVDGMNIASSYFATAVDDGVNIVYNWANQCVANAYTVLVDKSINNQIMELIINNVPNIDRYFDTTIELTSFANVAAGVGAAGALMLHNVQGSMNNFMSRLLTGVAVASAVVGLGITSYGIGQSTPIILPAVIAIGAEAVEAIGVAVSKMGASAPVRGTP